MSQAFFRVREPEVTFEDFKKEILVIDLKTGHYHSLRESAAHIWRLLSAGQSVEASLPWLAGFYGVERIALEQDVRTFVAELEKQDLIEPQPDPAPSTDLPDSTPAEEAYLPPVMESYTDLQDLLLLDPIHEVTAAGWPHKLEESA